MNQVNGNGGLRNSLKNKSPLDDMTDNNIIPSQINMSSQKEDVSSNNMMMQTIPLTQWMSSRWAMIDMTVDSVKRRLSQWPTQVVDLGSGGAGAPDGDHKNDQTKSSNKSVDENAYYKNAAVIAFHLLEHIRNNFDLSTADKSSSNTTHVIDPSTIQVTLRTEEETNCSIESVTAILNPAVDRKHCSTFYSLGEVLLLLFSRREISQECLETLMSRQETLHDRSEDDASRMDTFDSFRDTMQRALAILDFEEGGGGDGIFDESDWSRGRGDDVSSFSTMCANYPTLPISICRLIADVMEGSNGGYAPTKTAYTSLQEVLGDLKRMILEPSVFLFDPSDPTIDFGSRLHGREQEISTILNIADVVSSSQGSALQVISINGFTGSGKSFLANHIGRFLASRGWIFLQGKYDRMRQNAALSVMRSTFEQFFDAIDSMKRGGDANDLSYCDRVATKIRDALGPDGVEAFSQYIPGINKIVENEGSSNNGTQDIVQTGEESVMYQQRLEYLLCVFLDAVLSAGRPLMVLYDDIQWAGFGGYQFLQKLLKHIADQPSSRGNLLFVECCVKTEANGVEVISSAVGTHDSVNITRIDVGQFSKPALNDVISYALHLPPRVTAPLSEIIHIKTVGNILFVIEFMKSLEKSKMLTYNLSERQWSWDMDIVPLQRISSSVAGLIMSKLINLDQNIMDVLIMASCFGSQVNVSIMGLLNGLRGVTNISSALDRAVEEGILEKAGPLYMFAHNSLQETVYEITPKIKRNQLHLDIGSMLISKSASAPEEVIEELFSTALSNINISLPTDGNDNLDDINLTPSQRVVFAKLNLKAGQKAIRMSADFALARFHLNAGMVFLSENCWYDQYDLALSLHLEYAKVLLVQHEYEALDTHSKILLRSTRCIEDQVKVHELLISSLFRSGESAKALEYVRTVLDTLGFPLPTTVDQDTVRSVLEALRTAASNITPEQMHSYHLMTDEVPKQAMKIMASVPVILTFSSPTFAAMIACQMTQLTLQHGLCAESAVAFGNLGFAINSMLQDYNSGYDMGNLGLAIFQRFQSNTLLLKTYVPIFGFIKTWKEPLQSCSEGLRYAIHEGSLAGDQGSVHLANTVLNRQLLVNGCKLPELRLSQERLCREMMYDKAEKRFGAFFYQCLGDLYVIATLTGEADDEIASVFFSREECEKSLLELYSSTKNTSLLQLFYYHRFIQSFASRNFEAALNYCEEYDKIGTGQISRITDVVTSFLSGVIGFVLARKTNKEGCIEIGEQRLLHMQMWTDHGSRWNAENKALLLQAEKYYTDGKLNEAKSAYEASAHSARQHKFLHEEALAYEMYGIFLVETGHVDIGNEMLRKAQSLYTEWGAMKKASEIFPIM